jgi:hypothetical protein
VVEGLNFDRLHGHPTVGLALIGNDKFSTTSLCKIISQMRSDTDVVRLALSGEDEGKLRFSVAVNGGTAVVTCPVQRVRNEQNALPSETHELWLRGDALASTVTLPGADEIELRLFEHHVLFKEVDYHDTTVETFLFPLKPPRPVPSTER